MKDRMEPNIILVGTKQRRKEIREEAKTLLIGKMLSHPYFPHDIRINVSGIKESTNRTSEPFPPDLQSDAVF